MRITVQVKTGAREAKIEKLQEDTYKVWVTARPEKGKANEELVTLLAKHFNQPKSAVRIIIGKTSHEKLVEIN